MSFYNSEMNKRNVRKQNNDTIFSFINYRSIWIGQNIIMWCQLNSTLLLFNLNGIIINDNVLKKLVGRFSIRRYIGPGTH